jgi:hypothetical protein
MEILPIEKSKANFLALRMRKGMFIAANEKRTIPNTRHIPKPATLCRWPCTKGKTNII